MFKLALLATGAAAIADEPYVETIATRFTMSDQPQFAQWPQMPVAAVSQFAWGTYDESDGAWMLSADAIHFMDASGRFQRVDEQLGGVALGADSRLVTQDGALRAVLNATTAAFVDCASPAACSTVGSAAIDVGSVHSAAMSGDDLWIGANKGLFRLNAGGDKGAKEAKEAKVDKVVADPIMAVDVRASDGMVAAGGLDKLWLHQPSTGYLRYEWVNQEEEGDGANIDGPISTLAYAGNGDLWIGTEPAVNVLEARGTFHRIGGMQGLPMANVTSIAAAGERVYVGTKQGLSMFEAGEQTRYFYGERWVPGESIQALAVDADGGRAVMATESGAAWWEHQASWTLEQKAAALEEPYARQIRHGLINGCTMSNPGDVQSCVPHDSDNSGLWTSLYLAAESFRFAVTGDAEAEQRARETFEGMQRLVAVTGVKGLPARTLVYGDESHSSGGTWHNSTVMPGYVWKGDTSSDEIVGHIFARAVYHDLVAVEETGEKEACKQTLLDIMSYIVENNYMLIDVTGEPTSWGRWDPHMLNDDRSWSDARGLNSLQILSWLLAADRLSGGEEPMYMEAYAQLTNATNQYDISMVNQKITNPSDDNYSDDELAMLPFYTFGTNTRDAELRAPFLQGLRRSRRVMRSERPDLWSAIFVAALGDDLTAEDDAASAALDARWNLQTWPLELINWRVQNSQRLDVVLNTDTQRNEGTTPQSRTVLPANERSQFRWNGNPFTLDDAGGATTETDAAAWLLPYWLSRFHGLLS